MKKITCLILVFCGIVFTYSGCKKDHNQIKDLRNGCLTDVFSVPSWYTDSIYYSDNKISRVDKIFRKESEKNNIARFEYSDNQVKIYVRDLYFGSWRDVIYYTLSFADSKILQVTTNSGRAQANYFYDDNTLSYILYHKENKLTDSIFVQYDITGKNIMRALWYKFDQHTRKPQLTNTAVYSYDDKNNPHRNSMHFLYNFYDCLEYSIDYFNANNLKSIKSTQTEIHTDYTYNEYNYPTYIIYYDGFDVETDRNSICYNCN